MVTTKLDARLVVNLNGTWHIELDSENDQVCGFIAALSAKLDRKSDLVGRIIGSTILLEVKPKTEMK
jgi:hypothetical protein